MGLWPIQKVSEKIPSMATIGEHECKSKVSGKNVNQIIFSHVHNIYLKTCVDSRLGWIFSDVIVVNGATDVTKV